MVQRNSEWKAAYNFAPDKRKAIALAIVKCNGNLLRSAFYLGIHRSHLYRLVYKYRLWPLINTIRKRYVLEKHRKLIRGIYV